MKIGIVGAGAMGSLLAGLLAYQQQSEIWLIGSASSQTHLKAIKVQGLKLELAESVQVVFPALHNVIISNLNVTENAAEAYPVDLALILVKSYRTEAAAEQVQAMLSPHSLALTLQNGLGNLEKLALAVGLERSGQGVTTLAAALAEAGVVRWNGIGPLSLGLSPQLSAGRQQILQDFAALLGQIGLTVPLTENIQGLIWGKLIINCGINALGALLDVPNGDLLNIPAARPLMEAAASEAAEIARALGIILPYPYTESALQTQKVAEQTAHNFNSMLLDIRRNRPTEIAAINGAVVQQAQTLKLATPINSILTQLIEAKSFRALARSELLKSANG